MKQKKAVIKNLSSLENLSSGSKESKVTSESSHKYLPARKVKQHGIHEHKFAKCIKKTELPKKQVSIK